MTSTLERDGFAIVRGVLSAAAREALLLALGDASGAGRRGLLGVPAVRALARSAALLDLVAPALPGGEPRPVRAILFDKSPAANWLVPWHQDVTIAVRERREVEGFGPWSVKDGLPHVQPPADLLARMLAVRLHLDDCDDSNGALRVLPGSHREGRLDPRRIAGLRAATAEVLCEAAAGDALLMRPLLLHASGKSASDRRRRVLHIEFCAADLPGGLAWHDGA
jgi:hypothetical protein